MNIINKGLTIALLFLVTYSLALWGNNIENSDRCGDKILQIENRLLTLDKESVEISHIHIDSIYDVIIPVRNQEEFEMLSNLIPIKLQTYKNILVEIEEGIYFSNTNHIFINNQIHPNCRISFTGKGHVTIMATSHNLRDSAIESNDYVITNDLSNTYINPNDVFTDGENLILLSAMDNSVNCGVMFVNSLFEKILPDEKCDLRYKLKSEILPRMSADDCRNLWLWATHSWTSAFEKIDSIANGYIYLTADDEIELYQCPLNTDFRSWKVMPRIKIINQNPTDDGIYIDMDGRAYLPNSYKSIFKCDKGAFLNIKNSELKSVEISDIKFVGGNAPFIDINKVSDYAYIHDCDFTCQQNLSIRLCSDNGMVINNVFRNSMGTVIDIPNEGHSNHLISKNRFTNCGNRLLNQGCIKIAADNVLISWNIFHDNLIAALNVGVWHGAKQHGKIFSIIEDNLIYNDERFLKKYISNSLLDVSMLYVYTKNDKVIIRRNRLHGFKTLASGNGIYIDDGAYNVIVYDNIITNVDGKLYNINCRTDISDQAKVNAPRFGTNNFIANNIVDGPIRFEIREDDKASFYPKSEYGGCIFLLKSLDNINDKLINFDPSMDKMYNIDNIDLYLSLKPQDHNSIIRNRRKVFVNFFNRWSLINNSSSIYNDFDGLKTSQTRQ